MDSQVVLMVILALGVPALSIVLYVVVVRHVRAKQEREDELERIRARLEEKKRESGP